MRLYDDSGCNAAMFVFQTLFFSEELSRGWIDFWSLQKERH
jgi:hypothetical protein